MMASWTELVISRKRKSFQSKGSRKPQGLKWAARTWHTSPPVKSKPHHQITQHSCRNPAARAAHHEPPDTAPCFCLPPCLPTHIPTCTQTHEEGQPKLAAKQTRRQPLPCRPTQPLSRQLNEPGKVDYFFLNCPRKPHHPWTLFQQLYQESFQQVTGGRKLHPLGPLFLKAFCLDLSRYMEAKLTSAEWESYKPLFPHWRAGTRSTASAFLLCWIHYIKPKAMSS